MINFDSLNKIPPAKGRLLLSEPLLSDEFFHRSVILLCEHNAEGSFGFVLDKFIDIELNDLLDDFPSFQSRISVGGPLQNESLYFIHTLGSKIGHSVEIANDLYFGGDFSDLKSLIKKGEADPEQIRFFVGYSGWEPQQLAREMDEKSWIVTVQETEIIMDTEIINLWSSILRSMGQEYAILANFPSDPSLN